MCSISIIMLTYNRANMVGRMINCIKGQDYTEFEAIIINNGSTDNTHEIVNGLIENDSRFIYYDMSKAMKIGEARNFGVQKSSGKYITFVDDDDWIPENYLSTFVKNIEETYADFLVMGTEEEFPDGTIREQCIFDEYGVITSELALTYLLQRKKIRAGMPAKMGKRELFINNPFPVGVTHEDIHIIYRLLAEAERVFISGSPLYRFFLHENNISSFTRNVDMWTASKLEEYVNAFRVRADYIKERFECMEELADYSLYSYEISMCRQMLEEADGDKKKILLEMYAELSQNKEYIQSIRYLTDIENDYLVTVK